MTNALMTLPAVPAVPEQGGISGYLQSIRHFPVLKEDEEYMLAKRFRDYNDVQAAHRLVTSHLRLSAKIALGYRHYGLPLSDLISEGNIGLMQAVKRFDPDKGFRLSTYAMWWIKAQINEFVIRSWSLVKMGTVAAQKKLFYNLRKLKAKLGIYHDNDLAPDEVRKIAATLDVDEEEVVNMSRRMSGDSSLNARMGEDSTAEQVDYLADETPDQEERLADEQDKLLRRRVLARALESLKDRERRIIMERRLKANPKTLEEIGVEFGISRERVRQIENRAFDKLKNAVVEAAREVGFENVSYMDAVG